ncbi:MAG TPA: HDOD domain-containing protein [Desulfuromonadales bacterium]|nr:HDOD domain-containing protein [Desulfuromonadales bacterium]
MAVLFQAELVFMPLHDILQWIDMNRMSCVVAIRHGEEEEMTFFMESGRIIYATSPKPGRRLGEFLVRSGALTGPQSFTSLNESRKANTSFTRYLVEHEMITSQELTTVFAQLIETLLIDVFSNKSGSVLVTSPLPDAVLEGPIQIETGRAIFDAVRVMDERERDTRKRDEAIEAVSHRLYSENFQLPVMPGVMTQLVALLADEKSSFHDMAKLIMTDQVLISNILKIANSSFYGGSGQVDSLQFAIVRLGMREIVNIVTALQICSLKSKDVPQEQMQAILDYSLKVAFVASGLARECRLDSEEAFLGGLLLDLGKTVILSVAKDYRIEQALLDELLTARHAEIGAMIAQKWNYPETIQKLIRYHHNHGFGGISNQMIDLFQVADQVVLTNADGELDADQMLSLNLSYETVLDAYSRAMDTFDQIKSL